MTAMAPMLFFSVLWMVRPRVRLKPGRIGHVAKGVQYYVGNSYFGLLAMVRQRKPWADRDVHRTKDGVLVITHWAKAIRMGHFHDPLGLIAANALIEDLLWEEVQRLQVIWRGRVIKIHKLSDDMNYCAKIGIKPKYEPKSNKLASKAIWEPVKAQEMRLRKVYPKFRISGYALGRNAKCIQPMRDAGIPTSRIRRW